MIQWIEHLETLSEVARALYVQVEQWESLTDPSTTPAKFLMERGIKRKDIVELRQGAKVELHLHSFALIDCCIAFNTMGGKFG